MKTLLTILNRNKNHNLHVVRPQYNESYIPSMGPSIIKNKSCDGGSCIMFILAYIACNCIFCPVCFLIWSPLFYFIDLTVNPHKYPAPRTLSPTYSPTLYRTIYNSTY